VILWGIGFNAAALLTFGFARSIIGVVVLRSLQGLLNPTLGLVGSCVAESIGTRKHLQGTYGSLYMS